MFRNLGDRPSKTPEEKLARPCLSLLRHLSHGPLVHIHVFFGAYVKFFFAYVFLFPGKRRVAGV